MAGVYPIRGQKGGKPIIRDVAPVTDLLNMRSSGYVTRLTLFRHGSDRRALHNQRKLTYILVCFYVIPSILGSKKTVITVACFPPSSKAYHNRRGSRVGGRCVSSTYFRFIFLSHLQI